MKTIKTIKKLIKIVIILVLPSISVASETVTGKFVGLISLQNNKEASISPETTGIKEKADLITFKIDGKYFRILNLPVSEKRNMLANPQRLLAI